MNKSLSLLCAGALVSSNAAVVAVVLPSLHGCGCGAVGCLTGATLSFDVADDVDIPLVGTTASACFNDTCVTGELIATSPTMARGFAFPEGSGVSGGIEPPGSIRDRVQIKWNFNLNDRLAAGDRYSATVMDPTGAIIAMREATAVSYAPIEICGDLTCRQARFQ